MPAITINNSNKPPHSSTGATSQALPTHAPDPGTRCQRRYQPRHVVAEREPAPEVSLTWCRFLPASVAVLTCIPSFRRGGTSWPDKEWFSFFNSYNEISWLSIP